MYEQKKTCVNFQELLLVIIFNYMTINFYPFDHEQKQKYFSLLSPLCFCSRYYFMIVAGQEGRAVVCFLQVQEGTWELLRLQLGLMIGKGLVWTSFPKIWQGYIEILIFHHVSVQRFAMVFGYFLNVSFVGQSNHSW